LIVAVVSPPYVSERHRRQQESLAGDLARQFQSDAHFHYLAIGASADLHNREISSDGIHLNAAGYEAVADRLVDTAFDAVHQATEKP